MMKTLTIAAVVASTAAFAPGPHAPASTTALSAKTSTNRFSNEIGAQPPLGFWDPMGFLGNEQQETFDWIRSAEIKHGRIAMLATVGYLTTYTGVRIPGMEDIPTGFGVFDSSLYTSDLAKTNVRWTIATILILELGVVKDAFDLGDHPGDYRNGIKSARWEMMSDDKKLKERAKELNNGRAAMMGILALMVHENIGNVDDLLPFFTKG